jgi:hypothetical protein
MAASAWQLVCGLDAWRVTQIPRRPVRLPPAGADDDGDLLAAQRAAALSAAYHGDAGPVGFAWVRDCPGGPVQVLAAGPGMAVAGGGWDTVLKIPAGGRGEPTRAGGLARALGASPCRVRITVWAELAVLTHLTGWAMPLPDDPFASDLQAMRWALPDGSWLCEEEEPQFLASPYRWVLVLEALQDGQRDTSWLHAVAWGQCPEAALASTIGAKAGEADGDERVASQLSHFTAPYRWPLDHLTLPGPGHG